MLRAALEGLADQPVRVLGDLQPARCRRSRSTCRRTRAWSSGSRTRRRCRAATSVVCHAGHGTVARSLACGVPLVACPAAGDMGENASRIAWAGVGVPLPRRLVTRAGAAGGAAACWPTRASPERARAAAASWAERHARTRHGRGARRSRTLRLQPENEKRPAPKRAVLRSSGGGTRTHNLRINSPLALPIELPRTAMATVATVETHGRRRSNSALDLARGSSSTAARTCAASARIAAMRPRELRASPTANALTLGPGGGTASAATASVVAADAQHPPASATRICLDSAPTARRR